MFSASSSAQNPGNLHIAISTSGSRHNFFQPRWAIRISNARAHSRAFIRLLFILVYSDWKLAKVRSSLWYCCRPLFISMLLPLRFFLSLQRWYTVCLLRLAAKDWRFKREYFAFLRHCASFLPFCSFCGACQLWQQDPRRLRIRSPSPRTTGNYNVHPQVLHVLRGAFRSLPV